MVVEGVDVLASALDAGAPVESVYLGTGARASASIASVVAVAFERGARVFDLAPGVLERVADTVSPQPVLAVVGFRPEVLAEAARPGWAAGDGRALVVVCVAVRDPGNLGTIVRTAHASGASAVVCTPGTVDVTNPKVVRSSAGSLFHLPVATAPASLDALDALAGWGYRLVATTVSGGVSYDRLDWGGRVALVLGNEAAGLDEDHVARVHERATIPMASGAESLNVAAAAAVLCFEARRQRSRADGRPEGRAT
ncbi:MAG: RNA methyltransferase [Actinomycetota bacterium]|nr:RNA methyltransferase [Actinomycetota bacterium]